MAVTVWVPAVSAEVANVHVAVVAVVVPAVPATGEPPSITKFTLPVGVDVLVTVAVKVTLLPKVEGFREDVTVVVVEAVAEFTVNVVLPLLPAWEESPPYVAVIV